MPNREISISVITINYNNLAGLQATVTSVQQQSLKSVEHIVIDGCSSDGGAEFLSQNAEKFSYWISERDSGIYNAMNKGISVARGKYLLFLNSGDCLHSPDTLERANGQFNDEDLLYGDIAVKGRNGIQIRKAPAKLQFYSKFEPDLPMHPGCFFRRSLFQKFGNYDETYTIIADVVFISRILAVEQTKYKHLDLVISIFAEGGISGKSYALVYEERIRFLSREFPAYVDAFIRSWNGGRSKKLIYRIWRALRIKIA